MTEPIRVFATCDIGQPALDRLRERGYAVEVYPEAAPPPKGLVLEKLRSGIQALITTLRDRVDEEVFAVGQASGLRVLSQIAVGVDNIDRAAANRHKIPFTHTPDVLTDATAEYAFFMMGAVARRLYPAERQVRDNQWTTWHPFLPWLGDEVTGRTLAVVGLGRIGKSMVAKAVGFDMDVLCEDSRGAEARQHDRDQGRRRIESPCHLRTEERPEGKGAAHLNEGHREDQRQDGVTTYIDPGAQ